jgi:serine/threonine protein kinase
MYVATFFPNVLRLINLRLGHEFLIKHVHILHRDISIGNLMFRAAEDGQFYGVLNDFDLARFVNKPEPSPSSKHRTGTKPFVAIDLLRDDVTQPIQHLVRHDLESFFYVFAWAICRFHLGYEIDDPPFADWTTDTWGDVRMRKETYFKHNPEKKIPVPTEHYEPLQGLLDDWRLMWQIAFAVKENVGLKIASPEVIATYDEETMGGMITYQKIYELFNKYPLEEGFGDE